jgi:hypothetical protein
VIPIDPNDRNAPKERRRIASTRNLIAGVDRGGVRYAPTMCRSIKPLRRADSDTTTGEIEAAALQFVRKVSNYRTPSSKNQEAFDAAVAEIAAASQRMLETLGVEVVDGPNRWVARTGEIRYEAPHDHPHPHPVAG